MMAMSSSPGAKRETMAPTPLPPVTATSDEAGHKHQHEHEPEHEHPHHPHHHQSQEANHPPSASTSVVSSPMTYATEDEEIDADAEADADDAEDQDCKLLASSTQQAQGTRHTGLSALIEAANSQLSHLAEVASLMESSSEISSSSNSGGGIAHQPLHSRSGGPGFSAGHYTASRGLMPRGAGETAVAASAAPPAPPASASPSNHGAQHARKSNITPTFPEILHGLLTDTRNSDVLTFLPDGKFFAIRSYEFSLRLMGQHFPVATYDDFLELMRYWGFVLINDPNGGSRAAAVASYQSEAADKRHSQPPSTLGHAHGALPPSPRRHSYNASSSAANLMLARGGGTGSKPSGIHVFRHKQFRREDGRADVIQSSAAVRPFYPDQSTASSYIHASRTATYLQPPHSPTPAAASASEKRPGCRTVNSAACANGVSSSHSSTGGHIVKGVTISNITTAIPDPRDNEPTLSDDSAVSSCASGPKRRLSPGHIRRNSGSSTSSQKMRVSIEDEEEGEEVTAAVAAAVATASPPPHSMIFATSTTFTQDSARTTPELTSVPSGCSATSHPALLTHSAGNSETPLESHAAQADDVRSLVLSFTAQKLNRTNSADSDGETVAGAAAAAVTASSQRSMATSASTGNVTDDDDHMSCATTATRAASVVSRSAASAKASSILPSTIPLIVGAVEEATHTIVTDAIETLFRDEDHTRQTYLKHERELGQSSFPGVVVPLSKQLFSPSRPPTNVNMSAAAAANASNGAKENSAEDHGASGDGDGK